VSGIEPPQVLAGETVTFSHDGHSWEEDVGPVCDIAAPNSGHWYCATHQQGVNPNWPSNTDHGSWRKDCRAVWICHTHGPEQAQKEEAAPEGTASNH
jgi:hypothetical protein